MKNQKILQIKILILVLLINISVCYSFIPTNNSHLNITNPHFEWTYDNDEYTNFSLLISTNNEMTNLVYTKNNITNTDYPITTSLNENTHYWRIDVYVNDTLKESLPINIFTIDTTPPQFNNFQTEPSILRYDYEDPLIVTVDLEENNLQDSPKCKYKLNDESFDEFVDMTSILGNAYEYSINENWQEHEDKTLTYRCIATDYANNIANETKTINIVVNENPPVFDNLEDMTAVQNINHTFLVSAIDEDDDDLIFSSNEDTINFNKIDSKTVRAHWIPQEQHIGFNNIEFSVYDGNHYTHKTVEIFVEPKDKSPTIKEIGNIEGYLHVPIIKNIEAYYDYPRKNKTVGLYFTTKENLPWFKINTMYNFSDDTYIGKINVTPLLSHKGKYNITIIATDGKNSAKENITLRIGYCGDVDEDGEPICDAEYEDCESCPLDCGYCDTEEKKSIGIITQKRNCLYSEFTLKTYELFERATCENKGRIIDKMEVCNELPSTTINIYKLENKEWVEKDKYITDDNGKLTFIPETEGNFKIEAEHQDYQKTEKLITFKDCIDVKKNDTDKINQTFDNTTNKTLNETEDEKSDNEKKENTSTKPIIDKPTIIDDEENKKEINTVNNLTIFIFYIFIPSLFMIMIVLLFFYYQKEKNNNKHILKMRIQLIQYKKKINPIIKRYWIKTKDIMGF
ncbi:MAG: hypothetical protein ACLFPJ_05390 [Candidatus Woesearchaeota archaeon]